ncbi:flagellar hook-length control protein FliK [Methylopila turkensis]|uniref:Flagellar hook-length control protein n=1 Tax=Methylopila turkensis TaxID=1437816 RepID=A0A9W6JMU1_9HYPH|nr:flagellar hook-length control protein FliK [Methylopila turkensis]GLK79987.1 flagellar hook-length control protein [Methylopila turkensis]
MGAFADVLAASETAEGPASATAGAESNSSIDELSDRDEAGSSPAAVLVAAQSAILPAPADAAGGEGAGESAGPTLALAEPAAGDAKEARPAPETAVVKPQTSGAAAAERTANAAASAPVVLKVVGGFVDEIEAAGTQAVDDAGQPDVADAVTSPTKPAASQPVAQSPVPIAAAAQPSPPAPASAGSDASADADALAPEIEAAAKPVAEASSDHDASAQDDGASGGGSAAGQAAKIADQIPTGASGFETAAKAVQASSQTAPSAAAQVSAAVVAATQAAPAASGARRTRFDVQLEDGDLGRIDVRLDIASDGKVSTRLVVERPETLAMLKQDAGELARSLQQAGFQLAGDGLAFELRDGGGWARERAASLAPAGRNDAIDEGAALAAPLAYAAMRRSASALDLRV